MSSKQKRKGYRLENENLIICPTCEEKGIRSVIAKALPSGAFGVLRYHYKKLVVKIKGSSFKLICSRCGSEVFVRKEEK